MRTTYLQKCSSATIMAFAIAMLASGAALGATPTTIGIDTNKDTYSGGETIDVSLSAENLREAREVDAYVGLLFPDATLWNYIESGWDAPQPWFTGLYLPSALDMPKTPFFHFDIPDDIEGDFQFAAAFTEPGTLDFIGDPNFAPFSISTGTGGSDRALCRSS